MEEEKYYVDIKDDFGKVSTFEVPTLDMKLAIENGIEINIVDLFNNTGITIENFTEYNCDPNAYFTLSSLHPNEAGMDLITEVFENTLLEKYSKK